MNLEEGVIFAEKKENGSREKIGSYLERGCS